MSTEKRVTVAEATAMKDAYEIDEYGYAVGLKWVDVGRLCDEVVALHGAQERAVASLAQWLQHKPHCAVGAASTTCVCGLDAAVAAMVAK